MSFEHSMQISNERKSDRNTNYAILIFVIQIELKIEIEIPSFRPVIRVASISIEISLARNS